MNRKIIIIILIIFVNTLLIGNKAENTEKLKKEIDEIQQKIKTLTEQKKDILGEVQMLDHKLLSAEKEVKLARAQLSKIKENISELEYRINSLETEIVNRKKDLKEVILIMYKNRKLQQLEIYLAGDNILETLKNMNHLSMLSNKIFNQYEEYKSLHNELSNKKQQLTKKEKQKENVLFQRKQAWRKYFNSRNEKRSKIKNILDKRSEYKNLLKQKEKELEKIKDVIKEEKKIIKPDLSNIENIKHYKGKLAWPIPGSIIESFGIKKHPKYNITLQSHGIEIKPSGGYEKVRAVYHGIVVFADYVRSYGNTVIIEHPGKYYSLYSHLKETFVSVNSKLSTYEVLGIVGKTGIRKITSLYFSIRKGTKAENPAEWLTRKR